MSSGPALAPDFGKHELILVVEQGICDDGVGKASREDGFLDGIINVAGDI